MSNSKSTIFWDLKTPSEKYGFGFMLLPSGTLDMDQTKLIGPRNNIQFYSPFMMYIM